MHLLMAHLIIRKFQAPQGILTFQRLEWNEMAGRRKVSSQYPVKNNQLNKKTKQRTPILLV